MADATLARSDAASRDEELRPEEDTPIAVLVGLMGQIAETFTAVDRAHSRRKAQAFRSIHDVAFKAYSASHWPILSMVPESDRDLVMLAGMASMIAEQLPDIAPDDENSQQVATGVYSALISITGVLAERLPGGSDTIRAIYPELGRSIQRDVMVTAALRADMEALRHG